MITHLSINNLKLHDHTDLDLNGLTILTGMNGMGKSTVIQSLILLRQSFMMNDLDAGLNAICAMPGYRENWLVRLQENIP